MSDYISREAAITDLQTMRVDYLDAVGMNGDDEVFDALQRAYARVVLVGMRKLRSIPAADVREVVYCKDCRHRDPEDHKCDSGETERQGCPFKVADDYFCAYGER